MSSLKILNTLFVLTLVLLLSSCVHTSVKPDGTSKQSEITVNLVAYKNSDFNQVEATFYTEKSRALVFRILSDVDKTSQWLQRVSSLEVIEVYNNQSYLLRTVINSPLPFKDRELITCVNTSFEKIITTISISSCSDRVPVNEDLVRVKQVDSIWVLKDLPNSLVEVHYKTWIDPNGYVPAFIFNKELKQSTLKDLRRLNNLIENSVLLDFSY